MQPKILMLKFNLEPLNICVENLGIQNERATAAEQIEQIFMKLRGWLVINQGRKLQGNARNVINGGITSIVVSGINIRCIVSGAQ